jgi:kumamolisin
MPKSRSNPSLPNVPHDYVAIPGSERRPSKTARLIGAADPDEILDVTIVIRRRPDGPSLPDHEYFLSTPPAQRQRMPEEEFAAKYGASQEDLDQVVAFAQSHGLTVLETNAARRLVVVRGTVAQVSAAFAVELARYEHEVQVGRQRRRQSETYRGRDGVVSIPSSLDGIIVGAFGLDNRRVGKTNGAEPPNTNPVWVPIVSKLYNYPTNSAAGQTIGIFSLSGYAAKDITGYFANLHAMFPTGPAAPALTDILINGATNPGSDPGGETTQDIDIASSFAPGCAINVYITTGDQPGWVQAISRVAHPNPGDTAPSVFSSSWFIADGDDPAGLAASYGSPTVAFLEAVHMAFQDAAMQRVTVCIASGDRGTDSDVGDGQCHVQYPASDPYVLAVGGTTIGNIHGSSFDEYVWNDPNIGLSDWNWGTTGGGVSALFTSTSPYASQFAYQSGAGVPNSLNDGHQGRGVPDVAGNANVVSGYSGIVRGGLTAVWPSNGTNPLPGNGTSAAAPQWAGLFALINAFLGFNVGFVNPILYKLGSSCFRDIVPGAGPANNANGSSPGYPAGPGWDACTGWGSPNGFALLNALNLIFNPPPPESTICERLAQNIRKVIIDNGPAFTVAMWLSIRSQFEQCVSQGYLTQATVNALISEYENWLKARFGP